MGKREGIPVRRAAQGEGRSPDLADMSDPNPNPWLRGPNLGGCSMLRLVAAILQGQSKQPYHAACGFPQGM